MSQNKLLNKLSSNFKKSMFSKSKFLVGIPVLSTWYKYLKNKNNNIFYLFNNQLDYILVYFFIKSEITKYNINWFLINLLIKLITKKLFYYNINKYIKKLYNIP